MSESLSKSGSDDLSTLGVGGSYVGQGITTTMVNPAPFALTPGQSNSKVYIDHTSRTSIKLFIYITNKLQKTFEG